MATSLDLTSFDAALKVHYAPIKVKNLVYRNNPFLAMVPKSETFGGKNLPIPIQFGVIQGRSSTFADALANKYSSSFEDFVLTRASDYALADIDVETMEASVGDANAFMAAASTEIDSALHSLTRSLSSALFRSGTGAIGQISGTPDTSITLANTEDVVNFEVGMTLVASATDGGALGSAETVQITAVNRDTGVLTVTPDTSGLTHAWVDGDFLYVEGDEQAAGTKKKVVGLGGWLPTTAPGGGDSFFGVNRSVDATRLGGVRYDGSAETVEESLISGAMRLAREGGMPDTVVMNHLHVGQLLKELGSRVQYEMTSSSDVATISFRTITLHSPAGVMRVVADHNCPTGVAYMLQLNTWKFYSLLSVPRLQEMDGLRLLRSSSEDSVEVRAVYRGQLGCTAPGYNAVITLAS